MSIKPVAITSPQPSTQRGQTTHLSYDVVNDRVAYVNGKSIIVRPSDFNFENLEEMVVTIFCKHIHPTSAVRFSPSGFYIASGDTFGQVKIWDASLKQGQEVFEQPMVKTELQVMSGAIKDIAWDAENKRLIAVGDGKEKFGYAFTWDSGNSIGDIQGHSSSINAVDIKRQRPYRAATVGDDFAMVFFQGPPFKFDKSLRGLHSNAVRDVKFSANGEHLVSVGSDRSICIYNGKTGELVKKIENAHDGGISSVEWVPDSNEYFITASADGSLKKWDINEGVEVEKYKVSEPCSISRQQVGLAVTNKYVISLSANGDLNYFSHDGKLVHVLTGHQSPVTKVLFQKPYLYSGGSDGKFLKQEINSKGPKSFPMNNNKDQHHSNYLVDILADGDFLFTIGWDDVLKKWENGNVTNSVELPNQPKQLIKIAPGIIVLFESEIQLYSHDLKLIETFKLSFITTNLVSLTDSSLLLTNTSANTITKLTIDKDLKIKQAEGQLLTLRSPPTLIRVSPNGQYVSVADSTGKYTLLDANLEVVTTRWAFHTSKVFDAQWTSDSKYLISGGLDGGLLLYSVEKPSKVVKYPLAHASGVSSLTWIDYDPAKKAGAFVSAGLDGTIRTWQVEL